MCHICQPHPTTLRLQEYYQSFVERVAQGYSADKVKDGIFGAMMQVHLVNDGPVTMQLDTDGRFNDDTVSTPPANPSQS
jgi:D-Tyr-tRNA(Tyr) deacylase